MNRQAQDDTILSHAGAEALGDPEDVVHECVGHPGRIQRSFVCVTTGRRIVLLGVLLNKDHFHPLTGLARETGIHLPVVPDILICHPRPQLPKPNENFSHSQRSMFTKAGHDLNLAPRDRSHAISSGVRC